MIHLGQRFGGDFGVDGLDDRFTIIGTEFFDDIGQVRRMHLLERLVRNVQPQPALRVRLDNVAVLPPDGVRRNRLLDPAHPARRNHTLHETAEDTAHADIDFEHIQLLIAVRLLDLERDIGYTNDLPAERIDDLLIEQVADDPEHVLVGMIRGELLVLEDRCP